jgi:hypothetical protein
VVGRRKCDGGIATPAPPPIPSPCAAGFCNALSQKPAADPPSGTAEAGKTEQRQRFPSIVATERHLPYIPSMKKAADRPPLDRA